MDTSKVRQLLHRRLYQCKFQNKSGKFLKVRSVSTIKPASANSENTVGKDMRVKSKKCRSYEREGTCRFKECAFTHQESQGDARNQSQT